MRLTLATLSVAAVMSAASAAFAQPVSTYASGLVHDALGGVTDLTVDGRRLTACCIGSSGEDGVEVRFDSLWDGNVGIDLTPLLGAAGELRIRPRGWDGTIKGRLQIVGAGDGSLTSFVDFSDIGAIGVRAIRYDAAGNVLSDVLTPFPFDAYPEVPNCPPPGVPTWWQTSGGWWVWGCAVGLDPHGDPYPYLRVSPVLPPGVPEVGGVGSIEIRGTDLGALELLDATIGTFGVSSWGLGQAHIHEQCDNPAGCAPADVRLVADNLGSSGQDGVGIDLGAGAGGASLRFGHTEPPGHVIRMKAFDDQARVMLEAQTSVDPAGTGADFFTVDCSDIGATDLLVEFFDDAGALLRSYPVGGLPFGGWMSGMCGPGCAEIWEQNWHTGGWTFIRCDCLSSFNFELPTGEVVSSVHSMTFRPIGGGNPTLRSVELTSDDPSGSVEVLGVTVAPKCPGDLDGDGAVTLTDLSIQLSHFGQASGALPADGDVDGDGDVDLTDLSLLLSSFGVSCA